MPWKPLQRFADPSVAKLHNLRRAARADLRVPETVWLQAAGIDLARIEPPTAFPAPWIVRSASPLEDTSETTAAGQFETCVVEDSDPDAFRSAVRAVVESLTPAPSQAPRGAVFVQPLLTPERGGVLFFDGFSFEATTALGGNRGLTSGEERGEVERGQLQRGDAFSAWLKRLARAFRAELQDAGVLDVEFARDGDRFTLLQARPARFPLLRNPLLSLANHREILGDLPSPWVVSALEQAGADALGYFAEVDPEVGRWGEAYAVTVGGRAWLNFGFFFRLMDHWGLPRTFVTEGVGGEDAGPEDARVDFKRMVFKSPRLIRLQLKNLFTITRARRDLDAFRERVTQAADLASLHAATAFGLGVALRTNFAINGALTGLVRVRKFLRIRGRARVTTEAMMEDYDALRGTDSAQIEPRLDAWLDTYGHRGPLESDPARPRFAELRGVLLADLRQAATGSPSASPPAPPRPPARSRGPFFILDRRREWFRDELMRIWQELRGRILETAEREHTGPVEDAFLWSGEDFAMGTPPDLPRLRADRERLARIELPGTATRDEILACLEGATATPAPGADSHEFPGTALSDATFEGTVHRADDLVALLEAEQRAGHPLLDASTVLVVRALEPSWAVVFGRVGAVITELGGELSHASILLREAGKPAIVNCPGAYDALEDGERVRLEGARGVVVRAPSS